MTGTINVDPKELKRAATALGASQRSLASEARTIRSTLSHMSHFKGREADKFRAQVEEQAKAIDAQAAELGRRAATLEKMARDVAKLRLS